jgi:hypothetical protein
LFAPSGDIGRWAKSVNSSYSRNVKNAAPVNRRSNKNPGQPPVGSLRAGISTSLKRVGPRQFLIESVSTAPYTKHVLFGTGRIYAKNTQQPAGAVNEAGEKVGGQFTGRGKLNVPPNFGYSRNRLPSVRGQSANNFFEKAMVKTAIKHPSLRGGF